MEPLDPDDEATALRPARPAGPPVTDPDPDADTVIRRRPAVAAPPPSAAPPFALAGPERFPLRPRAEPARGAPVAETAPTDPVAADARLDYSFSVNGDPPIGLEVPALVGRKPALPRIPMGRPPRLVRVPSPLGEVSGTHLELRQQGASVVVTDLRSTNGTVVVVPGRAPLILRQGESAVVVPGTVVDIGEGNTVEILPGRASGPQAERRAS